jgi:D-threo-aldose 1-dehydrogenase
VAFRASLRPLTREAPSTPVVGLGCAPIGNLYTPSTDEDARATVAEAHARGFSFFDTAPHYGAGVGERRLGLALQDIARDEVVIATKVGRRIVDADRATVPSGGVGVETVGDLTRDGVLRSVEGSLARLGTDRIDLLYLHDPADVDQALGGAMAALLELRDEGVVRAIGVGMMRAAPLARFVRESDPDVIMVAGRLTLLDRSAEDDLLPAAREHDVGIIAAGVFNSGILADPDGSPFFEYRPASPEVVRQVQELDAVCRSFGVTLAHAAARFPLRHDGVEAIVIGARTPGEVRAFADGLAADLPEELWPALEAVHERVWAMD